MATHSSTLAWKILWTEGPARLQALGSLRVTHSWATSLSLSCLGEGNGNPLQCSCLENPRDGGAWWADVYGVAQSRTRLTWLSSSLAAVKTSQFYWCSFLLHLKINHIPHYLVKEISFYIKQNALHSSHFTDKCNHNFVYLSM